MQICIFCATDSQKSDVVDFLMWKTLGEIDIDRPSTDNIIITLPCKHTFTIETLDGICDITSYYTRDANSDLWTGLTAPPLGFKKPPACPTCRAAIVSPRYGRVYKRSDLDILEKSVASQMAQALGLTLKALDRIDIPAIEGRLKIAASATALPDLKVDSAQSKRLRGNRSRVSNAIREHPLLGSALQIDNSELHDVSATIITSWKPAVQEVLKIYDQVIIISQKRSAHTNAYDAAFKHLYDQELARQLNSPANTPARLEEHAFRVAMAQVGQQRPLADKRYLVEAFWISIDIRLLLVSMGQAWLGAASNLVQQRHKSSFGRYIGFILQSCSQDSQRAVAIAFASQSHRQVVRSSLYTMRVFLEQFRFEIFMLRDTGNFADARLTLLESAEEKAVISNRQMQEIVVTHRAKLGSSSEETKWLKENFSDAAKTILSEWSEIQRSLRSDTFYEPVRLEEKMAIVRALDFSHTGHFYTCENGHPFTIGEVSFCHLIIIITALINWLASVVGQCKQLDVQSAVLSLVAVTIILKHLIDAVCSVHEQMYLFLMLSTAANDLEQLAREAGAQNSPWQWGQ